MSLDEIYMYRTKKAQTLSSINTHSCIYIIVKKGTYNIYISISIIIFIKY